MADNTRKSEDGRENAVSDEKEATSNVTSTGTRDQSGDDVGEGVGDFCNKQMPEGTDATPLAVTSKILYEGVLDLSLFKDILKVTLSGPSTTFIDPPKS